MANRLPDHDPLRPRAERWRRRVVWLVPAVVVAGVVSGATLASGASGAAPNLAPRTVAELLTAIQTSDTTALSGKITETANLGLPDLPGADSTASLSWQNYLAGSHSVRVWADGQTKQRLAVIGELSEADVVHNGRDLWTYTSDTNTVTHTVLAVQDRKADDTEPPAPTPAAVTNRVLKAVNPSTSVTLGKNQKVAGRSAYTLVIAPRDAKSTVRKVTVAVDSRRFVPLQVKVYGDSGSPALNVRFTDVSFRTPPSSTFAFKVPAGATVSTHPFTAEHLRYARDHAGAGWTPASALRPRVIGSGWTAVVEVHDATSGPLAGVLGQLTSPVGNSGERLLHTAVVNAVVLPDGRAFVGAVRPAALEHIAATTAG